MEEAAAVRLALSVQPEQPGGPVRRLEYCLLHPVQLTAAAAVHRVGLGEADIGSFLPGMELDFHLFAAAGIASCLEAEAGSFLPGMAVPGALAAAENFCIVPDLFGRMIGTPPEFCTRRGLLAGASFARLDLLHRAQARIFGILRPRRS